MSQNESSQQQGTSIKARLAIPQVKILLAALVGAIIGSGASLHTYHTLMGGGLQGEQLSQILQTAEHTRMNVEEMLARQKEIQDEIAKRGAGTTTELARQPSQRQLTQAIDGLFEGLPEGDAAQARTPSGEAPAASIEESQAEQAHDVSEKTPPVTK